MPMNEQPNDDAAKHHVPAKPDGDAPAELRSRDNTLTITSGGGADAKHPHLFHLSTSSPSVFEGGQLQGAVADNWSVLGGQQGSVYLARLEPGGVREPHWHPSAWEFNFIVSGRIRWSIVGPAGTYDAFEGGAGDLVFATQGHLHYFENASETDDLVVLIAFNSSAAEPDDDIGIVASLSSVPPDVPSAIFKAPPQAFANIPKNHDRMVIAKKALRSDRWATTRGYRNLKSLPGRPALPRCLPISYAR